MIKVHRTKISIDTIADDRAHLQSLGIEVGTFQLEERTFAGCWVRTSGIKALRAAVNLGRYSIVKREFFPRKF